jgi:nitrate reductase beta subunit
LSDFNQLFLEPLVGGPWKNTFRQAEFKDGWKCSIHQKKQKGNKNEIVRVDAKFKDLKIPQIVEYFMNPPPSATLLDFRTVEVIDKYT